MTRNLDVPDEYAALYRVYEDAYEQASEGKGKERHASEGEAYEDQIICEVARRVGLGYPLGQAVKKIYESQRLGGDAGVQELLGALNYVAAAVIVMREGLEAAPKAEGNAKGEDWLIFKSGDPVEWFSFRRGDAATGWHPAFYLGKAEDPNYHVVQDADSTWRHVVHRANIRSPEAKAECCGDLSKTFAKENPPESCAEPEFKRGDRVEVQMVPDSSTWASAAITAVYRDKDSCEWRYCVDCEDGWAHVVVPSARVRPVSAPKAEGCEALVEKDAPQTREELYSKILESNPATFKARTPTGELAEMAEEEPHG